MSPENFPSNWISLNTQNQESESSNSWESNTILAYKESNDLIAR
jgi:hypothetical protein